MLEEASAIDWLSRVRLKLRHLRLFVALDQFGRLQRAAEHLGISEPAASKLLSDLEAALGMQLFVRQPRGLVPNEYGEILVRHSRMVLAELERAGSEIAALRDGSSGSVAIGSVSAPGIDILVAAIGRVRELHPLIQITVQIDPGEVLIPLLLAGELDFAICRLPPELDAGEFDYRKIGAASLSMICRSGHPLACRPAVELAELVDLDWVLQPPGTTVRRGVDAWFRAGGLATPERCVNTKSFIMTLALLRRTDAIAVLPSEVAELFRSMGSIALLPLTRELAVEPVGLIRLRGRELSPAARIVLAAVEEATLAARPAPQTGVPGSPEQDLPEPV